MVYFQLLKKKVKLQRPQVVSALPTCLNFLKKPRTLKFSFLFFYLIKKKNIFFRSSVEFFLFNSLYLLFFKKVYEILMLFQRDIFFIADIACNTISRMNDLNFFYNKYKYIYIVLRRCDLSTARVFLQNTNSFFFLFVGSFNRRFLFLNNVSNICPLLAFDSTPTFFDFFLPTLIDFHFSIYFYKYFFYNFLKNNRF